MKKLMFLAVTAMVLTVFNACQKDELQIDQGTDLEATEKPDVYLENDYLVFKDYETLDSISDELNKVGTSELIDKEKAMGFKSARTYRYEKNEKILAIENLEDFEKATAELAAEGYFNLETRCMDFPFDNDSWSTVLNKSGVVKIGDVLYCYNRDKLCVILNGDYTLLKRVLNSENLIDNENVRMLNLKLKSTYLSDFGEYFGQRKEHRVNSLKKFVMDVELVYTYTTQYMNFYIPDLGQFKWMNVPVGVKYQIYCHLRVKKLTGWADANAHMYHKCYKCIIGGNYVSAKNSTYYAVSYSNDTPEIETSAEDLSNHYFEIYRDSYPFTWNGSSDLSDLAAPATAPVITNIDFDVWTGKVGSENDCTHLIVN